VKKQKLRKTKEETHMADIKTEGGKYGILQRVIAAAGRILFSIFVPAATFVVLYIGFRFLRDSGAPQIVITIIAIFWGVGGVAALYLVANWLIQRLPRVWRERFTPFLFVGPALIIIGWYLFIPTIRTLYLSFFDKLSNNFIAFENYKYIFTNKAMLIAMRNNLLWLFLGTGLCVIFGLAIALLTDRSKIERAAKSLIFLPMAISFVGASVIWKFVYAYKPAGIEQVGLLNAIVVGLGGEPVGWITIRPWNTIFLIIILVWLQTGFAMVILSAAVKGVPKELLEAARIDGAKEMKIIFRVIIPYIKSTIVTVSTTILLLTLKVFDIVYAMTNGLYGTEVLASQQYKQMFKFLHYGRGSAIAMIILVAVIPVIWYNLKQFNKREVF
jgi:alpha-glucoside transport system permease protein